MMAGINWLFGIFMENPYYNQNVVIGSFFRIESTLFNFTKIHIILKMELKLGVHYVFCKLSPMIDIK